MKEKEIWKDIIGYEGVYQICNKGIIKSLDRYIWQSRKDGGLYQRFMRGRTLSLKRTNGNGYISVQLRNGIGSEMKNYYMHTLIAENFILNPENKLTVNHIDANKSNNRVENLEWATYSEQMVHAYNMGLNVITEHAKNKQVKGSQCYNSKLNENTALQIYNMAQSNNYKIKEIAKMFLVCDETVRKIKNKKTWIHIHNNN